MSLVKNFAWKTVGAEDFKAFCLNVDCFACQENIPSVVKIGWLIRCECCGQTHSLTYYERELKKSRKEGSSYVL